MTFDLGDGKRVTIDAFHGQVWLTVAAHGGGVTVAMPLDLGKQVGAEIFNAARREGKRASVQVPGDDV